MSPEEQTEYLPEDTCQNIKLKNIEGKTLRKHLQYIVFSPRQAHIAMCPFCLLRVETVPSGENSASRGGQAGLILSSIAVSNVSYALSSILPLKQPLKMFQKEIMLNFCHLA